MYICECLTLVPLPSFFSRSALPRPGRQEEAHATLLLRAADLRAGEDLRADQVFGRPRSCETGLRAGHEREPGQGELVSFISFSKP